MAPKRKTQKAKAPTSKKKSRTQSKSTDVYVANQTAPAISSVNQVNVAVSESTVVQLVRSLARMLKLIFDFRILLHVVC